MEILNLHLVNYRNFTSKGMIFDKDLAVIIGPNGSGKSNILEAISILAGVRPAHVQSDLDLVKFAKSEAKIQAKVSDSEIKKNLTVNFLVVDQIRLRKSFLVDSIKKRLVDFINFISIIVFEPRDLELVTGSPSLRRHYLDSQLASLDRDYWRNISSYSKIVIRRNRILQRIAEGKSKRSELDFWDDRLLEHASYIRKKRGEFFEFLNFVEKSIPFATRTGLSWELRESLISEDKLIKNRDRDIAAGVTLSGPHRDDFRFLFGRKDLAFFGSRGEQRMAVLALKLAELEYFRLKMATKPILGLDDIFSELDAKHREAIVSVVAKQQTIITAAEITSVPKKLARKTKIIELG